MNLALAFTRPPHALVVEPVVRAALEEDLGRAGDITSQLTIPAGNTAVARLVARTEGKLGLICAEACIPPGGPNGQIHRIQCLMVLTLPSVR